MEADALLDAARQALSKKPRDPRDQFLVNAATTPYVVDFFDELEDLDIWHQALVRLLGKEGGIRLFMENTAEKMEREFTVTAIATARNEGLPCMHACSEDQLKSGEYARAREVLAEAEKRLLTTGMQATVGELRSMLGFERQEQARIIGILGPLVMDTT